MKYLFLHYGPGGNSALERDWLDQYSSKVDFWDQPVLDRDRCHFKVLVEQAIQKFNSQVYSGIITHSFGSELALQMNGKTDRPIDKMIFISPLRNIPLGFASLAQRLSTQNSADQNRKKSLFEVTQAVQERIVSGKMSRFTSSEMEAFWNLVQIIAQDPFFYRAYWSNQSKLNDFEKIAAQLPQLNMAMWQSILADFLMNHFTVRGTVPVPLSVYLGADDPYYSDINQEIKYWKNLGAKGHVVSGAAHYPHLEQNLFSQILK